MLRGRGGDREAGVRHTVRLPPVELDDALGLHAPGFEVRADTERGHERHVALGELADGRVVEMVVVVVRHDHEVDRRQRARETGTGWKRLGPARRDGEARGPRPDRSAREGRRSRSAPSNGRARWRAARSRAACAQVSSGFIDGSGPRGTRRSPPQRNSLIVGIDAFGSRRPGMIGCTLRNRSPVPAAGKP